MKSVAIREKNEQNDAQIRRMVSEGKSARTILENQTADLLHKLCSFHGCFPGEHRTKNDAVAALLPIYSVVTDQCFVPTNHNVNCK